VGLGGFEPPTSALSGLRSNQLSYRPEGCKNKESKSVLVFSYSTAIDCNHALACCNFIHKSNLCERLTTRRIIFSIKEVIQPQVPLRLPCYDFTPVMNHTVVSAIPKVKLPTSGTTHSHGVTGGVYKARERIHRDILIRDY
jgi:hypothetical protein